MAPQHEYWLGWSQPPCCALALLAPLAPQPDQSGPSRCFTVALNLHARDAALASAAFLLASHLHPLSRPLGVPSGVYGLERNGWQALPSLHHTVLQFLASAPLNAVQCRPVTAPPLGFYNGHSHSTQLLLGGQGRTPWPQGRLHVCGASVPSTPPPPSSLILYSGRRPPKSRVHHQYNAKIHSHGRMFRWAAQWWR